ncbi:MAG: alanine--tRNA ligase-related protein, partial [Minisyncoccales bacterium]
MSFKEIRQKFLDFFLKKNHKILPSVSLLSPDPTVLFTTAGMQPLSPFLSGEKDPISEFGTRHLASCQK